MSLSELSGTGDASITREETYRTLKKKAEAIKSQITGSDTDIRTSKLVNEFMEFNNDFRKYTHSSHKGLSAKEMLELRRDFIDLTDAMEERIVDQMRSLGETLTGKRILPDNNEDAEVSSFKPEVSLTESDETAPKGQKTIGMLRYVWGLMNTGVAAASNVIGGAAKVVAQTSVEVARTGTNALGFTTPVKSEEEKEREELETTLKALVGIQEALYDAEHPMSVEHARKLINETLNNARESDVAQIAKFLQSEAASEKEHQKRATEIQKNLDKIRKQDPSMGKSGVVDKISSFVQMIQDEAGAYLVKKRQESVRSFVEEFTPQKLFGNLSFRELITGQIKHLLTHEERYRENSIVTKIALMEVGKREKHLSDNLGILADERNLACLGANIAEDLRFVASKIRILGDDVTSEQMIASLGYTNKNEQPMTFDEFREQMDKDIITNFARLISKDALIPQEKEEIGSHQISKGI